MRLISERENALTRRRSLVTLGAIVLLAFALRTYKLEQQSFNWDEIKSVERAMSTLPAMLESTLERRNQLPLYYAMLGVWTNIGNGEFEVRYLSTLLGTLSIAMIYKVGRIMHSQRNGLLAATMLAVSPFHVWYTQEARMYALIVLLLLVAHGFLVHAVSHESKWAWVGYSISMSAAVYTHYFSFLALLAHCIFFALSYSRRRRAFLFWTVSAALAGVAFLPWAWLTLNAGGYGAAVPPWIDAVDWRDLTFTVLTFSTGHTANLQSVISYLVVTMYLLAIFAGFNYTLRSKEDPDRRLIRRLVVLWFATPIALTFVLSAGMVEKGGAEFSLYVDRYLIISLPPFLLLAAWGLDELLREWPARWIGLFALVVMILGTFPALYNGYFDVRYWRTDWRGVAGKLAREEMADDVLLVRADHRLPITYYGQSTPRQLEIPLGPANGQLEAFAEEMTARLALASEMGAKRAWLISNVYPTDPHHHVRERNHSIDGDEAIDPQQAWMNANYARLGLWRFIGIQLSLYRLPDCEQNGR